MRWPRLFELEDQRWLPRLLRNQVTDALHALIVDMQAYAPSIPELLWVMQQSKTKQVIDLCSGGSGPWPYLLREIRNPEQLIEKVTLTDLYPNQASLEKISAAHPLLSYKVEPVNALQISSALVGVRTLFSSFHHFNPPQATAILQDAVNRQMPICIFEFTGRRKAHFLLMPLITVLLFTRLLFRKPFSLSKLLFSYLIPIAPLIFLWDSTISLLHSYSQEELEQILAAVTNADSFIWEIGENSSPKTPLQNTYLIGYPKGEGD